VAEPEVDMRCLSLVAALALSFLCNACGRSRERPGAPAGGPPIAQVRRETGPWVRVSGSVLRQELDTTSIIRISSNMYEGWVRRPIESSQEPTVSYHARYQVDCLSGLVRATRAAVYDEHGKLTKTLTPVELLRSGESRWSDVSFRDLAVVGRAICARVWDANLPIVKRRGDTSRPAVR
jgi:hypothetical protein